MFLDFVTRLSEIFNAFITSDPPGRASLTPAALNYELEENAAILPDISCSADCEPDCEILWQKEGSEFPNCHFHFIHIFLYG